uniref:Cytochrome P450 CYP4 n=1 Tax=Dermanyssus gallinae TaxID=34641 RepID=A0A6M3H972_9ACAR|nr:cytochrome P450 CYP4 [Dermanyssus gallinae]
MEAPSPPPPLLSSPSVSNHPTWWWLMLDLKVIVGLAAVTLTLYVVDFYRRLRSYPPGPMPLPFIGNIHQLRGPSPLFEKAIVWSKKYGDPLTIWIGARPLVIANTKQSFRDIAGPHRNNLGGRMQTNLGDLQKRGFEDIVCSDLNPAWDVLRKVTHVALRKYAKTEELANLVAEQVDREIGRLPLPKENEARSEPAHSIDSSMCNEATWPFVDFAGNIINNIMAVSAFGEGFQRGDSDYDAFCNNRKLIEKEGANGLPSDLHPMLGLLLFSKERKLRKTIRDVQALIDKLFETALKTHATGTNRHFIDTLLNARAQFVAEDRSAGRYLSDGNVRQAVLDIFVAATDTTRAIISFGLLHLANEPQLQEDLRAEVLDVLGHDKVCQLNDRDRLVRLDAFIQEVIRFYPPAPFAIPRRALVDVEVNGRPIPRDTGVFTNLFAVNRDTDVWGQDAREFRPERFLNVTKDQLQQGFNSFGIGSRACPGEKMALANILYVFARVLQRVRLRCASGAGSADLSYCDSDILLLVRRNQDIWFSLLTSQSSP